jgi:hypothetical protein
MDRVGTRAVMCCVTIFCQLSCSSGSSSSMKPILNGPSTSGLTTYWRSLIDGPATGCILADGNGCYGPLLLALTEDQQVEWRAEDKDNVSWRSDCCQSNGFGSFVSRLGGTTTWTQLGPDLLVVNGLPFEGGSLTLREISGGVSRGQFTSRVGSLNITWEIHTGRISGVCPSAGADPDGAATSCACCTLQDRVCPQATCQCCSCCR